MSSLERLIKDLCPHGVEHKTLTDIGKFIRGQGLQKVDFVKSGEPCIHYGQIYTFYGKYATEAKSFVTSELKAKLKSAPPGSLIITTTSENVTDVAKAVVWLGEGDVVFGGHSCAFVHNENPRYLSYVMESSSFQTAKNSLVQGTKVKDISILKLASIKVPIPPRAIQNAIAETLDKFYELRNELESELTARTIQFDFVRDLLLAFETDGVDHQKIRDLVNIVRAKEIVPRSKYGTSGSIPIVDQGQQFIAGWTDDENKVVAKDDYVVFGDHTKTLKFVDFSFAQGADGLQILKAKDLVIPKYLYYVMSALHMPNRGYNRHWTLVRDLLVPVPTKVIQAKIVSALDNFEHLVSENYYGLPFEIASRRKQLTYYRELLFSLLEA